MVDSILYFLHRIGLWTGLMLVGVSSLFGGLKAYEHVTYLPAQVRVVGLSTKCDMSYRSGRQTINEMVECADVARIKKSSPDIDWKVQQVPFVDLAYTVDDRLVRTTVRQSKIERSRVTIGETIPVLRSPADPQTVTAPPHTGIVVMTGALFAIGLSFLAVSWWAKRRRERRAPVPAAYAVAGAFGQRRSAA